MTALALSEPILTDQADLQIERAGIEFHDVAHGRVAIRVRLTNCGSGPSAETVALLQAAPFGAFVPWTALRVLRVPALKPGESYELCTRAVRTRAKPLGPPDRVPPRRLLTALGADDPQPEQAPSNTGLAGLLGPMLPQLQPLWQSGSGQLGGLGRLPVDLNELLGRANPYWAGNLNVFVGVRAVERHLSQALRVYPGKLNLAMFVVGSRPDAYRFHLEGEGADWDAALYDFSGMPAFVGNPKDAPAIPSDEWIELPCMRVLMLALCPPPGCGQGSVEVHVRQRSTHETAVVEFSLDPNAAGAGCYVVG
jgi:hypothetical protein